LKLPPGMGVIEGARYHGGWYVSFGPVLPFGTPLMSWLTFNECWADCEAADEEKPTRLAHAFGPTLTLRPFNSSLDRKEPGLSAWISGPILGSPSEDEVTLFLTVAGTDAEQRRMLSIAERAVVTAK